jgi:glycosyltransferase involved in cell wall biosynthesis
MRMKINELLTIVIPCKNESDVIGMTLDFVDSQKYISNTRVIVCDSSTDYTKEIILSKKYKNIKVELIDGGVPSVARNKGAILSETKYILFLDADMFLTDNNTIYNSLKIIDNNEIELLSTKFRCRGKYSYVYPVFEFFRDWTIHHFPFVLGGFMLFNRTKFFELGGFNPKVLFAEDYDLSSKIHPDKIFISNHKAYTTDRRFKKKGLLYMIKMMFLSILNKNNPSFFEKDHNYWK